MNVPEVGKLITSDDARRDAIHVAVAPVVAGEDLPPGTHVGLFDGQAYQHNRASCIGVVDPFLTECVRKGQRFYLFMYPNTITSLRHVWSHPAFRSTLPGLTEQSNG